MTVTEGQMASSHFLLVALGIALASFLSLLGTMALGRRQGRLAARDAEGGSKGLGGAEGAVYGLLGLLIAFSFSGAATRLDKRRSFIVDEANAIGTAYLRLDLLPPEAQPPLREAFRAYVDSRIGAYRKLPDVEAAQAELDRSVVLQRELWKQAVAIGRLPGSPNPLFLLSPLNQMFDLANSRSAQIHSHPPFAIFAMLVTLALVSSFLVGFGMASNKGRSRVHAVAYAAVLSMVIYLIVDLEFPRLGLIRINGVDGVMVEMRQRMN